MTTPRDALTILRNELLTLHRELIQSERVVYERTFGTIDSATEFLQLLTNDPWFAWMLPLSSFIARIDAALADKKEPVTLESAKELIAGARALLSPNENGEGFPKLYFEALHRDPHVLMAHAAFNRQWAALSPEGG